MIKLQPIIFEAPSQCMESNDAPNCFCTGGPLALMDNAMEDVPSSCYAFARSFTLQLGPDVQKLKMISLRSTGLKPGNQESCSWTISRAARPRNSKSTRESVRPLVHESPSKVSVP
jgi:hypothetical protein